MFFTTKTQRRKEQLFPGQVFLDVSAVKNTRQHEKYQVLG